MTDISQGEVATEGDKTGRRIDTIVHRPPRNPQIFKSPCFEVQLINSIVQCAFFNSRESNFYGNRTEHSLQVHGDFAGFHCFCVY